MVDGVVMSHELKESISNFIKGIFRKSSFKIIILSRFESSISLVEEPLPLSQSVQCNFEEYIIIFGNSGDVTVLFISFLDEKLIVFRVAVFLQFSHFPSSL
jgi:hypothetical protein